MMHRPVLSRLRPLAPLAACALLSACPGPGDDAGTSIEDEVAADVEDFRSSGDFTQINDQSTGSQHGNADLVDVWVSKDAADRYADIDPADTAQELDAFPVGTLIVKDHLDDAGDNNGGYTVMSKRESGYNDEAGDWWWGLWNGEKFSDKGKVGYCIDCHEGNDLARVDWAYGVATDNRK